MFNKLECNHARLFIQSQHPRAVPAGSQVFKGPADSSQGVGVREWCRGEDDDRRGKEGRHGRQGVPRRIQRIPELGGAGRTVSRGQAKGELDEAGSPILGRRRQTPGSKMRVPAALQEKRGRRRGEVDDRRGKEERRGRQGVPRRIQRIPELGGAGRTVSRVQAKGELDEAGSPILGRRRQTPGSKTRVPAALQEKRGRRRRKGSGICRSEPLECPLRQVRLHQATG
ncbi:hypothetical protein NDU88_006318 [Pleurodeles waltl]|uniref:Uncharacterized protein n=1 Tax=Pleurodeles waltl TaxID=8319 RepID=A0AAV7SP68_PLEWA|nr:hypothetical protein NDU88_006318 [Pleurodeles waltl]